MDASLGGLKGAFPEGVGNFAITAFKPGSTALAERSSISAENAALLVNFIQAIRKIEF
jgi:hypothetical protein